MGSCGPYVKEEVQKSSMIKLFGVNDRKNVMQGGMQL